MTESNPVGLRGIEFVEFSSPNPTTLHRMFVEFGFSRLRRHRTQAVDYYNQGGIHFLLNREPGSFADGFHKYHGPCISSMGWRVKNAREAFKTAVDRGARPAAQGDYTSADGEPVPAIYGIGDSLIYFIDGGEDPELYEKLGFQSLAQPELVTSKGFTAIDHLTNNVHKGTMEQWANFYQDVFGFTEVRYFDIRGVKTGLQSYALRSPCQSFCIPINEGTESKSQINEYLEEYKGPGVQHLAFLTEDIITSVEDLQGSTIETLDIDDDYYDNVFDRVPGVTENREKLRDLNILVDGDDDGYLLQIFTKNLIGPIFIEVIQRKNHLAFGEGNFGALFRSIEKDQERRGYL